MVLECGGSIGQLKIVKWGSEWLSAEEFESKLRNSREFAVSFLGEFDYDEDQDDVHPREFRDDFQVLEDIVTVERYDGGILNLGSVPWPRTLFERPVAVTSNLEACVLTIIDRVCGDDVEESLDERVVGCAAGVDIVREVTQFRLKEGDGLFN